MGAGCSAALRPQRSAGSSSPFALGGDPEGAVVGAADLSVEVRAVAPLPWRINTERLGLSLEPYPTGHRSIGKHFSLFSFLKIVDEYVLSFFFHKMYACQTKYQHILTRDIN